MPKRPPSNPPRRQVVMVPRKYGMSGLPYGVTPRLWRWLRAKASAE